MKKLLLAVLLCLCLAINSSAIAPPILLMFADGEIAASCYSDDFTGTNDDPPDEFKWTSQVSTGAGNESTGSGAITIQGNTLNILSTTPTSDDWANVVSNIDYSGDFDVQVDFDITTCTEPASSENKCARLIFYDGTISIEIARFEGASAYHGFGIFGTSDSWTPVVETETSGKLRLTRSGSTLKAYYWDTGDTQWEWGGSTSGYTFTTTSSSNGQIYFGSKTESTESMDVDFDNFTTTSGTCAVVNYLAYANAQGAWYMNNNGGSEVDRTTAGTETLTDGGDPETSSNVPPGYSGTSRNILSSGPDVLYHATDGNTDITGTALTLAGWINVDTDEGIMHFIDKWEYNGGSPVERQYALYINAADKFMCSMSSDGTTYTSATNATSFSLDTWMHVACVYNGTDIRIYINGQMDWNSTDNPKAYTTAIPAKDEYFRIGADSDGSAPFNGHIDEVIVLDIASLWWEIGRFYARGIDGTRGGND